MVNLTNWVRKNPFSTIKKKEQDHRKSLEKQREIIAAKQKVITILKSDVQQFQQAVQASKDSDRSISSKIQKEIDTYREKLESSQVELTKLKQNFQTQDLTFRVIQGE